MRLRDYSWWPSSWACVGGSAPSAGEVSQHGIFITARLASIGLSLAVDYNRLQCTAIIPPTTDPDFLPSLRDKLQQYAGRPMREIENLELNL